MLPGRVAGNYSLAACAPQTQNSRLDMYNGLMQAGHAGKWAAILIPFLHVAFAISGADDEQVIACRSGRP